MSRAVAALCLAAGLGASACNPDPLAGSNVLLLVADALRADHLGCYGYAGATSPFLDARAERGVLFESATSTSSHTVPATLSLLTAAHPHQHGNQYFPRTRSFRAPMRRVRPEVSSALELMPEHFAQLGYRTGAVVANPWLDPRYGFDRGFERYRYLAKDVLAVEHIPAAMLHDEARALLSEWRDERFFLYVHYMDTHNPYRAGPRDRERLAEIPGRYVYSNGPVEDLAAEDLAHTRTLYDAGIRGLDDELRALFGILAELGLEESTLVVFSSDHGDEFHEHGGLGHGRTLYQEVVRVPLLFLHPALRPRRIAAPVSSVDVLPTLLDLVGAEVPPDLAGISLAPWIRGNGEPPADRVLVSELADLKVVRRGRYKALRSSAPHAADRFFDLEDDPGEQRPLAGDSPWAGPLQSALSELAQDLTPAEARPAAQSSEEDHLEQQLRALGYAE